MQALNNGETIAVKIGETYFEVTTNGEVKGEIEVKLDTVPGEMDGAGTENNPFVIMSIEDLVFFSKQVNEGITKYSGKYIELGKTLDFNSDLSYANPNTTEYDAYLGGDGTKGLKEQLTLGKGFKPIGESATYYFGGSLDGKNNTIKNIKIDVEDYAGLFGYMVDGIVQNIAVTGNVKGTSHAAGIIGRQNDGKVINCTNYANVTSTEWAGGISGQCTMSAGEGSEVSECANYGKINSLRSGGILGWAKACYTGSKITDNFNNGDVYGEKVAGGIVGTPDNCEIVFYNCLNGVDANIESNLEKGCAGGIYGDGMGANIYNCINLGTIKAWKAGGIVGSTGDYTRRLRNCYSTEKIEGTYAGGIVGRHNYKTTAAETTNCYYLLSETITSGVGYNKQTLNATGIEELNSTHLETLNAYIENDPDELGTTNWRKWRLDENGNPNFVK